MKISQRILASMILVSMGYVMGSYQWESTPKVNAEPYTRPDSADILKIREAYNVLTDVRGSLINGNRHQNALTVVNPLAVCSGGINVIDLSNWYSCAFIATQDLGKQGEKNAFEILGRFDHSDVRGCNLLMA